MAAGPTADQVLGEPLLKPAEVAEFLGIGRAKLDELVQQGFPAVTRVPEWFAVERECDHVCSTGGVIGPE